MKDRPDKNKPTGNPKPRRVPGHTPAEPSETSYGTASSDPTEDELKLPRGGLAAMRRSGGFRFTSREVIVYRDGRVVAGDSNAARGANTSQHSNLNDEQLAELNRTLSRVDFDDLPATSTRRNPDAYTYELVARVGTANYSVEVTDGSIPQQLSPLVRLLTGYLTLKG